ncbi:TolC family protein [Stieleria magnilauensis]
MIGDRLIILACCMAVVCGCATVKSDRRTNQFRPAAVETSITDVETGAEDTAINAELVSYEEPNELPAVISGETFESEVPYSLSDFEAMAMSGNPTLQQAQSQVTAAQGAAYQAGLYPNPVVGYSGEYDSIAAGRDETWNGGFIAQEFVTGGKLRLSREKWCQRAKIARTNFHAQQHRILNDVRSQFYQALAAQRLVGIQREILANGEDRVQTYQEMLNLGQTNQAGLLTAEVDLQRDRLNLNAVENEFEHAWRLLVDLTGSPELMPGILNGVIEPDQQPLDWETALSQLMASSPEIQAANQRIQHDRITVERERVEPIPNLLFDVATIHTPVTDTTQTTFNVGLPIPLFDRNKGTIQQAQADLSQSHAEAQRLQLELRTRLATQFRDYQTSWKRVVDYDAAMLPKAKKAYEMLDDNYRARRAAWPDVLMAQRMYLTLQAEQTRNLVMYRQNDVAVRGMLLTGGLMTPPPPVGAGHIDAVAKPR